jgi:hypothetical protein
MGEQITFCTRKAANGRGVYKNLPRLGEELSQRLEFEATLCHMIRLEIQRKFS